MNKNLKERMESIRDSYVAADGFLREEHAALVQNHASKEIKAAKKQEIIDNINDFNEICNELAEYKNAYKNYKNNPTEENLNNFKAVERFLCEKYDVVLSDSRNNTAVENNEEVERTSVEKKDHIILKSFVGSALAIAAVGGIACGLKSCDNPCIGKKEESEQEEEKPYAEFGEFTNAKNEKQVKKRAKLIYDKYIATLPEEKRAAKAELSVETIENMIRVCNGVLPLDNGEVTFNEDVLDEIANDFATYYNQTSFIEYGNNLEFRPVSIFFEEGSLAHEVALRQDEIAEKIYANIRNNNVQGFHDAAVEWGEFLRDTFIYKDFDGKTMSIRQVETPSMFPVTSAIISLYAPTIEEYSQGVDLARRDGMFGDKFGICVPFCYNEHNDLQSITLSKLVYDINCTPMNDLARRAGMYEEWASCHTPITVDLWNISTDYYKEMYNREKGNTLSR